ncbi:MAG: hypothetical protein DRP92_02105 [Candidatus Neomarinimicrobiota bacterium]|nr:MAG: hypothetical protein DRP92_02105 [Candidatus Neomarinimicrobiota bacterium]
MTEKKLDRTKRVAYTGLFIALVLGIGYAFVLIPNVEFVLATIFISGILLGWKTGIVVGTAGELLFSALNPFGSGLVFPLLLFFQILVGGLVGYTGGLLRRVIIYGNSYRKAAITSATAGFLLTFTYDLFTNLSYPLAAGFDMRGIIATVIAGLGFSLIHIITNTFVFLIFVPYISRLLHKVLLHLE